MASYASRFLSVLVAASFLSMLPVSICAQAGGSAESGGAGTPLVKTFDGARAVAVFKNYCSACHVWSNSWDELVKSGHVLPGDPEGSSALKAIENGSMPADGRQLLEDEKKLLRDWIASGASKPPAIAEAPGSAAQPLPGSQTFLGFPDKESFHRVSGWTGGGLLLAAGIVGAIHAYDLHATAHAWRDANYPGLDDFDSSICGPYITNVLYPSANSQALRWTHVGLLAAGESLYIANALTGVDFMGHNPNPSTKSQLHRYAFFLHAGLMMAQGVMGYFTTEALRTGDHETFTNLLVAHGVIGLTIPVIILGTGTAMSLK